MSSSDAPSRHVNLWRKPNPRIAPKVFDRLDEIQRELEQAKDRRARCGDDLERFKWCVRSLCLDVFAGFEVDPTLEIGINKKKSKLTRNALYPKFVTARAFLAAYEGLKTANYIQEISVGTEASGKTTRIRATERLIEKLRVVGISRKDLIDDDDTIHLKIRTGRKTANGKPEKKRVRFDETEDIVRWRENVRAINENTRKHFISLDPDALKLEVQHRRLENKAAAPLGPVDFSATSLHRVFNSYDFQEGGRFFGAWWQEIPRSYRKYIKINQKDTCEYDFSSIHIALLYAKENIPWPRGYDPYSASHGPKHRDVVKMAINKMLNAKRTPKPSKEFSEIQMGISWQEFLKEIEQEHTAISKYFRTGIGTKLQRMDADIAEAILLEFLRMGYPCLPVHDSFITYATLEDELPGIMQKSAIAVHGLQLNVKPKEKSQTAGCDGLVEESIDALLRAASEDKNSLLGQAIHRVVQ